MSKELTYTMIEEAARAKFGISRDEYALCNYIQTWASHPAARFSGYCDRTRAQMAEFIGIGERGIQKMLPRMVSLGLIERSKSGFNYRITAQWFDSVMLAERARKGEQSSPKWRTKFTPDHEQSSPLTTNKVHPHTKYNTELHTEIENAPENSPDAEAKPLPLNGGGAARRANSSDEAENLIREWANGEGRATVKNWIAETTFSEKVHGKVRDEITKFVGHYAVSDKPGVSHKMFADPVTFFKNRFKAWLVQAKELNRPAASGKPALEYQPSKYLSQP